ncbi:MAG TPA: VCBS repeat-containing protein [Anaerolineales bacterium]|nr:VCBS repeat-containing protein [Anaerolineales bacterium]
MTLGRASSDPAQAVGTYKLYLPIVRTGLPPVQAPQLKWQNAGCYSSWCETGWYASPAIADLDGDTLPEVVAAAYSIFILDGSSGNVEIQVDPDGDREWPGVVVADIDNDADLEILTAHDGGYLHAFNHLGSPLWSQQPTPGNELRSLATSDLDDDGDLEILVASTISNYQWWVYDHNGAPLGGSWPQHGPDSDTNGYTAGAYNENLAVGDLDGDGRGEVVGPNDTHYLAAFHDDGTQIQANPIYGTGKPWSRVGVHVDHYVDLRGYANCGTEHRPNFAHSPPIVVDVNNDGIQEAVVVGNVYNCGTNPYSSLYEMPFILNGDRTRWAGDGFDWTVLPIPDGSSGPLMEDYNVIESSHPNPVAADLDGDGFMEIIYPSYDGRLHAYWLDKTEHHDWPFEVQQPGEGFIRFAAEPAVADLNADGFAEVIFASWVQKGTNQTGKLHILDWKGRAIHEIALPGAYGGSNWNGSLAAPSLGDIDGDPGLELVLNTAHSGFVAYELPGTQDAVILWSTGRGSNLREGHP